MEKQLIISIGREFGSAGHEIADRLAKHYGLPMYDHNLLREVAKERGLDAAKLEEFDEKKRNKLLTRTVRGMSNSPAQNVAQIQFDFLREKAESGKSFVVVGRCSEYVLKDYGVVSIFILGDMDTKVARIQRLYNKTEKEAKFMIADRDKSRKAYHNSHCPVKWGDSRGYDLSLNSSRLGMDESVKILTNYIDTRMKLSK